MKLKSERLLIGDTHPEIIAVAREYSKQNALFTIILPLYFTVAESRKLSLILPQNSKFRLWLLKRTLPPEIINKNLRRPFATIDLLLWCLKKINLNSGARTLSRVYKNLLQSYLFFYLQSHHIKQITCYDTINLPRNFKNHLVVICPMSHPNSVGTAMMKAKKDFPFWFFDVENQVTGISAMTERASDIVVLSQYSHNTFERAGFPIEKLHTIAIGPINGSRTLPSFDKLTKPANFSALFVGYMGLRKGVPAIMQASYQVEGLAQFRLVGPTSKNIASFIRENSNSKTLTVVENPDPENLRLEFESAQIFVMPSYNDGFGIACIEGMTYGHLPIISRSTGVSEILIGTPLERFLVAPGSTVDIVRVIRDISELTQKEYVALRRLSYEISQKYSMEFFAVNFVELFK